MAFQKKYYYSFGSVFKNAYTVEIWQNTDATLTAEEIIGSYDPFKVMYPLAQRFEPVRGSGADINIISTESMKFVNLYTADKFEYQVKLLSGATLLWVGYLDTELYSEPFNEKNNYTVSLTANDGLALLERMEYLQTNGTAYTGFSTNWDIIKIILLKLGISWNNVYVYLSTTCEEVTQYIGNIPVLENILEKTYSNNQNYYDEDVTDDYPYGKPMSCRDVLESILTPFGAHIQIINGNVYITDINNLASNSSALFYKYNGSTLAYVNTETLSLDVGDVSDIKFAEAEQTLTILSPVYRETIRYSPYISETLIDYKVDDDTFSGYTSTSYYGTSPYTWTESSYSTSKYWTIYNMLPSGQQDRFRILTGTNDNKDITEKYLVLENTDLATGFNILTYSYPMKPYIISALSTGSTIYTFREAWSVTNSEGAYNLYWTNDVVTYGGSYYLCNTTYYTINTEPPPTNSNWTLTTSSILNDPTLFDNTYYLKIEAEAYTRTKENLNGVISDDINSGEQSKYPIIYSTSVKTQFKIGNYYLDETGSWTTTPSNFYWNFKEYSKDYEKEIISDKWVSLKNNNYAKGDLLIPLFGFTGNVFTFSIQGFSSLANREWDNDPTIEDATDLVKDVRLKDIKFTIVDSAGKEIENFDIEYTSYINKLAKSNIDDMDIILGTNKNLIPTSKGSIIGYNTNYFYIQEFTRGGTTDQIEHLLARSLHSNYKDKSIEIQCTINKISNLFGTLTYDNYFSGKVFGIQEAEINYHEDNIKLTMHELKVDDPDIEIKITY